MSLRGKAGGPARTGWLLYLMGAPVVQMTVLMVVSRFDPIVETTWYLIAAAAQACILMVAMRVHRPRWRTPWRVLPFAYVLDAAGSVLEILDLRTGETHPWLSGTSTVCYWLYYPVLAIFIALVIRGRTPGRHLPALIDTAIFAVSVSLVWWIYVVQPSAGDLHWTDLLFPLPTIALFAAIVRLMLGAGLRSASYRLLVSGAGLLLLTDTVNGTALIAGVDWDTVWTELPIAVTDALIVASALHPSMARLADKADTPPPPITSRRLLMLGGATLLPTIVLMIEHQRDRHDQIPVIAGTCAVLFILVVVQLYGLLRVQRRLAVTDTLTSLYTRAYYDERLRKLSDRAKGQPISMIIADADHFKSINDRYGHPAGDAVLRELARRLRAACRTGDVVARFGGEEFVVLLPGTDPATATEIGERIRTAVAAEAIAVDGDLALPVTVSVGVAGMPAHAVTAEDLLKVTDAALYVAKHNGRNQVVSGRPREPSPTR